MRGKCLFRFAPALSPSRLRYFIDCILCQDLEGYPGVGADVHVSGLAYADDIMLLINSCMEMQGLLDAVNHYAAAVGMRFNASKIKVKLALIPGKQRQLVLLDAELLEDIDKLD